MRFHSLRSTLVVIASMQMLVGPILAQQPFSSTTKKLPQSTVVDIALGGSRTLEGEVRDSQGQPGTRVDVALWSGPERVQLVKTDRRGRFQFRALQGGVYRVSTHDSAVSCRAWFGAVAPPHARTSLLLIANGYPTRGQQPINEVFCFNPFLMGTIIAAAIAIPIAVHDDAQVPDGS